MSTEFEAALNRISEELANYEDIQLALLKYLDENDDGQNLSNLTSELRKLNIGENQQDLDDFLRLLSHLASYHHRTENFFPKIVNLLSEFKEEIANYYSNEEIFSIFQHVEPIIILLRENGMLQFDSEVNFIINSKDNANDIFKYYNPEDKTNVEENQKAGENHEDICKQIRLDKVTEFIENVSKNNIPLDSKINPSPFETNAFLKKQKDTTLLQYAAFCGSLAVFNNIIQQNQELLDSSIWEYSICGRNYEIIQILKEKGVAPPNDDFVECLNLSVLCHYDELTINIQDELIVPPQENQEEQNNAPEPKHLLDPLLRSAIHSHNFIKVSQLIKDAPEKALNELFQISCKYGFHKIIEAIINLPDIEINKCEKTSALQKACNSGDICTVAILLKSPELKINLQSMNRVDVKIDFDGLTGLQRAIRYGHNKVVKLLLSQQGIDVNQKSRWMGNYPLNICSIYGNIEATKLLLSKPEINPNNQCHDEYRIKNDLTLSAGRETPLHHACEYNHPEIVKLLLAHDGIDANLMNWEGKKPIDTTDSQEIKALFSKA